MIIYFVSALLIAIVVYQLGAYVTIVAIVVNVVKLLLFLTGIGVAFWLIRRWWRGRRAREVAQIPSL